MIRDAPKQGALVELADGATRGGSECDRVIPQPRFSPNARISV